MHHNDATKTRGSQKKVINLEKKRVGKWWLFWSSCACVCVCACMCVWHCLCMCAQSLQSCLTLCDHVDCSPPGSMGFSKQEYWSRLPFHPPGDLPNPGVEPTCPVSSALVGRFFITEPPGKPHGSVHYELTYHFWIHPSPPNTWITRYLTSNFS